MVFELREIIFMKFENNLRIKIELFFFSLKFFFLLLLVNNYWLENFGFYDLEEILVFRI